MMRERESLNLTSLTDIVSNSVGMLVIFLLMSISQMQGQRHRIQVPVEEDAGLRPVFFISSGDAIRALPADELLKLALEQMVALDAPAKDDKGLSVPSPIFRLGETGLEGQWADLRLWLRPVDTADWERSADLTRSGSDIRTALDAIKKEQEFAFFFVSDEEQGGQEGGFVPFALAAEQLRRRGVRIGWMPISTKNRAYLCSWSTPECAYRPSSN